ncbi:PEP-CTERM-box response regulator transcription factor [Sphingomonas sp. Leaf357]|uniref:PEP-CTERM-box response regulator transcription factor n=1 Tax=Sphingomonas sp. Leaf357 TaxID=1736350 RepID=UPI0006FB5608|nr:PEP-CTERM-box response regulator transcription factor [Sphingomonas sp. Leaf357]KQS04160.1 PEP-CTERM-box response regulator transcription factor [Sphingomonas sp. Leaf357]
MTRVAKQKLLIVEDDIGLQSQLEWAFEAYDVIVASDRKAALSAVRNHKPAVVTLDLGLPPDADGATEGLATLREIVAISPETKVIVASGHEARESAQTAIALGAHDFYAKPINIADLGLIVARAFHIHALEAENQKTPRAASSANGIITGSAEMMEVLRTIDKVADAEATVMLLGASGTGKELLAKAIHTKSSRSRGNFVAINCAAIPDTLLEAELFGHERGAFTGAVKMTVGKIEMAQGGTLFLDEIGDVPAQTQVKLLRFLQERVIERIGGRKAIPVDTRVVTATHQDLATMMREGQFREDLYFRLAEIVVKVPTLAERDGDAVLLARHFLQLARDAKRTKAKGFTPDALAAIAEWPWTGNVRELENRVKRATIMADGAMITARDLDLGAAASPVKRAELRVARERADRLAIAEAIAANNGNLSAVARDLDISRPMLYDLMNSYGISKG